MSTVASILLGADGSTAKGGSSRSLSSPADRARFLDFRKSADVIVIGGATARAENYSRTPSPLIIVSHDQPETIGVNPQATWWNISPEESIVKATIEFGEHVHVEAGLSFLVPLLKLGLIDQLRISISTITGGSHKISLEDLTYYFSDVIQEEGDETVFVDCARPIAMKK